MCTGFQPLRGGLVFKPIVELVHEEEKKLLDQSLRLGSKVVDACKCFAQALCSASSHEMTIPFLLGFRVRRHSSLVTARPLRLPRCVIVGHVWSNNVYLYYG